MRRTGLSMVVGAVLAIVCGEPKLVVAQVNDGAAAPAPADPSGTAASEQPRRRLSDSGELERIISLYAGGKYDECAREVLALLEPDNPQRLVNPHVVQDARLYHATCLVMDGREKEAIAPLRRALTENPTMGTPDSLTFPPPLISLFLQVRKEFADAIRAEEERNLKELAREAEKTKAKEAAERLRVQRLEELASTELVIFRNRRWIASIPFGVGQFQNGDNGLGAAFAIGETLMLGTAVAALAIGNYQYTLLGPRVYGNDVEHNIRTARRVSIVAFYGFLAVAAGGIAEAHMSFVPEFVSKRKRQLPEETGPTKTEQSQWVPWLAPGKSEVSLGVMGRF